MAAKKGSKRESYSVYLLQVVKPNVDVNDPQLVWPTVGVFRSNLDARLCARLLGNTEDYTDYTFAIEREIRQKEEMPKSKRELI